MTSLVLLHLALTSASWIACIPAVSEAKPCRADRGLRYVEDSAGNGWCERCPPCSLGEEWDRKVNISTSIYGDLECRPCVPCMEGFYRDVSYMRRCYKCTLNCTQLNRLEGTSCSPVSKGNCNSCLSGYEEIVPDTSTPCVGQPSKPWSEVVQTTKYTTPSSTTSEKPLVPPGGGTTPYEVPSWLIVLMIALSVCALVSISVIVWLCEKAWRLCHNKCCRCSDSEMAGNSTDKLMEETSSSDGSAYTVETETNDGEKLVPGGLNFCLHNASDPDTIHRDTEKPPTKGWGEGGKEQVNNVRLASADTQSLQTDGSAADDGENEEGFPAETLAQIWKDCVLNVLNKWIVQQGNQATLWSLVQAVNEAGLNDAVEGLTEAYMSDHPVDGRRSSADTLVGDFCTVYLHQDHTALDCVASKVYPRKVLAMFRCLRIGEAVWGPELIRFIHCSQTWKDFVLNVLIRWTQQAGDEATLEVLLKAAKEAGFDDIVEELKQAYMNNNKKKHPVDGRRDSECEAYASMEYPSQSTAGSTREPVLPWKACSGVDGKRNGSMELEKANTHHKDTYLKHSGLCSPETETTQHVSQDDIDVNSKQCSPNFSTEQVPQSSICACLERQDECRVKLLADGDQETTCNTNRLPALPSLINNFSFSDPDVYAASTDDSSTSEDS